MKHREGLESPEEAESRAEEGLRQGANLQLKHALNLKLMIEKAKGKGKDGEAEGECPL